MRRHSDAWCASVLHSTLRCNVYSKMSKVKARASWHFSLLETTYRYKWLKLYPFLCLHSRSEQQSFWHCRQLAGAKIPFRYANGLAEAHHSGNGFFNRRRVQSPARGAWSSKGTYVHSSLILPKYPKTMFSGDRCKSIPFFDFRYQRS